MLPEPVAIERFVDEPMDPPAAFGKNIDAQPIAFEPQNAAAVVLPVPVESNVAHRSRAGTARLHSARRRQGGQCPPYGSEFCQMLAAALYIHFDAVERSADHAA